jgi:hypothetical protein
MNYTIGEVIRLHRRSFTDHTLYPDRYLECVVIDKEEYIGTMEQLTVKIIKTVHDGIERKSSTLPNRMNNTMTINSNYEDVVRLNKLEIPFE